MEIHLADKLGVSRTPIREAIRKLELEGLVTMIPRRGAEVAQITEKNLRDVLEVRRALDALAVELACERITEDELAELKKACENFELETKRGNANQVAQADVELHDIILKASGNERLMQMISKLSQQMYRYRLELSLIHIWEYSDALEYCFLQDAAGNRKSRRKQTSHSQSWTRRGCRRSC